MGLKLISGPATQAITATEAKANSRVNVNDDDTIIALYIDAAIASAEAFLGRALVDQTWDLYLDNFPTTNALEIKIPKPPLIEVVSIKYDDDASPSAEQTVSAADYYVDTVTEPGWIVPAGGATWPSTLSAINSVRIRFRAGYVDNAASPPAGIVPADIRQALLLACGSFYEHREDIVIGQTAVRLPFGVEDLLRKHRVLLGMD